MTLTVAIATGTARSVGVPTPTGPYELHYSIVAKDLIRTASGERTGTCTFIENHGCLRIDTVIESTREVFSYEKGHSLLFTRPTDADRDYRATHSAIMSRGFGLGQCVLPLYMPYDFRCQKVFYPLQDYRSITEKEATSLPSAFVKEISNTREAKSAILISSLDGKVVLRPVEMKGRLGHSMQQMCIFIGGENLYDYRFEHPIHALGTLIPSRITVTTYMEKRTASGLGNTARPSRSFTLSLDRTVTDPTLVAQCRRDTVLTKGDWVSYQGPNGLSAGVIVDPSQGSFDSQLRRQTAAQVFVSRSAHGRSNSSARIVACISAAAFALALVVRVLRLSRRA